MGICPREIGERIKKERIKSHYTQEEFSEILSVGRIHLANIENGRKMASLDLLVDIADTLGCSLDYLILGIKTADGVVKQRLHNAISLLQFVYNKLQ